MKEEVDLIIKAKYVVTLGPKGNITRGAIAISNGSIVDVGSESYILSKYKSEDIHEYKYHMIVPGFVDCHTHTQQLLLRTSIDDKDLELPPIWTKYLIPFENMISEQEAYISSLISLMNMVKLGTTTFIEAGAPYPDQLVRAINEIGIRGYVSASTLNVLEDVEVSADKVLEKTLNLLKERRRGDVEVLFSIRQLMMVTEDLIDKVRKLCSEYRTGITMHLAEYQCEVDFCLNRYGMRPLEFLDYKKLTGIKPFIAAHAVFLSREEIEIVMSKGLGICWCPTVDSYLMGNHWLGIYYDKVVFGFGSDGGAFTNLDLLHESKVARALTKSFISSLLYSKKAMDSKTVLTALTGNKGKLLGIPIGCIDKGFKADLVVIRTDIMKYIPIYNPINAIVNFIEGECIEHVYINGRKVVDSKKITTIDEELILNKFLDIIPNLENLVKELKRAIKLREAHEPHYKTS